MRRTRARHLSVRPLEVVSAERILDRSLRILAVFVAVSAVTSVTFFHPDEHFQTIEFASVKLGLSDASELPWEYAAQLRPWLQPALYTLIGKVALVAGMTDRFHLLALFRIATALFSFLAFRTFARVAVRELPRDRMRIAFARSVPLFGFLPYLFVRTSSETFAGAFLALSLAVAWVPGVFSRRRAFVLGAVLGLAFEARFQMAFAAIGLLAWLAFVRRVSLLAMLSALGGGVAILLLASVVDAWGYGAFCFPPWNYVRENVFNSVAASFGREPFWAYPLLVSVNVFLPLALVALAAMGVGAWRFPRHILPWVVVPFFVAHSLVSHKEERFLFPLAPLVPALVALAFSKQTARRDDDDEPSGASDDGDAKHVVDAANDGTRYPLTVRIALAVSVPVMLVHLTHPIGFRPQLHFASEVARANLGEVTVFVPPGLDVPDYPFLRARKLRTATFAAACFPPGEHLMFSDVPEPAPYVRCAGGSVAGVPVASELPFVTDAAFATLATRAANTWNALRDRGWPVPYLRFATILRVSASASGDVRYERKTKEAGAR